MTQTIHGRPAPSAATIAKAGRYVADGAVTIRQNDSRRMVADVQGTDPQPYRVVWDAPCPDLWVCSCRAGRNGLTCAHILACMHVQAETTEG